MNESEKRSGKILSSAHEDNYRRFITYLHREIKARDEKLKGVEALTKILANSEAKIRWLETKLNNYEVAQKRYETRIAQLNKRLGIGPQTAFENGAVSPGISRKDFDALTRENIKLKEALDHIVAANLGGEEVILKNRELYELVSSLRDELSRKDYHIKELEVALKSTESNVRDKNGELTKQILKHERSAKAKQVFCETLIKENSKLKDMLERQGNSDDVAMSQDVVDGQTSSKVTENAWREECEKLKKSLEEKEKLISENKERNQEIQTNINDLSKKMAEMSVQKERAEASEKRLQMEMKEVSKRCADLQKKCDGFFKQVVSLNNKQKESEEEMILLNRASQSLREEIEDKKVMIQLMTDSLKTYEDDFRRENEEKASVTRKLESSQQENQRLKRENQSNITAVRHMEAELERMNKLLNEERRKINQPFYPQPNFGQAFAAAGTRSLFPEYRPMQVVADGPGDDEVDSKPVNKPAASMPAAKPEPQRQSSPTLIECPYCSRSYPYHLIEGHVQDCMEDSLYMDD